MSLILEALKKSERQRRLGESPSLGSPVMAVRRRRNLLPALIGLITVGLAVLWWMGRESTTPERRADVAASAAATATKPQPAAAVIDSMKPAPAAEQKIARVPTPTPDAQASQREKLRSGELVAANPQAGAAATIKESAPVSATDTATIAAAMAEAAKPVPAAKEKEGRVMTPAGSAPAAATAGATGAPADAAESNLKLIWELPLATRRSLPELKLSMHVFATQPDQRFVIINGERRAQGDEFEGLKLIEIRSDGIVLEYEGARFLYPRGGR